MDPTPMDPQPAAEAGRRRFPSTVALAVAAGLGGLVIGVTGIASAASSPSPSPSTGPGGGGFGRDCPRHQLDGGAGGAGGDSTPQSTAPSTGATPSV